MLVLGGSLLGKFILTLLVWERPHSEMVDPAYFLEILFCGGGGGGGGTGELCWGKTNR